MHTVRRLGLLTLAFCLAGSTATYAYTYKFVVPDRSDLTGVYMHTVSAFCRDVRWSGRVAPGGTLTLSTQSVCLVNRVSATGQAGAPTWSSPFGVASGTFKAKSNMELCYNC